MTPTPKCAECPRVAGSARNGDGERICDACAETLGYAPPSRAPFSIPPAAKLFARLARDGGWTLNPRTGRFVTGAGYVVANPPSAQGLAYGKDDAHFLSDGEREMAFREVVALNADILARPGMMLGAWRDAKDGTVYLEVSEVFARPSDAIRVAKARGERAIYDLRSGRDIRVDGAA
jgi:hypothetical protein